MTRVAVVFSLIYYVNESLTDFIRRLKSSERSDGNEDNNNNNFYLNTIVIRALLLMGSCI